jgi:transcription elongation factor SPT5
VLLEHNWIFDPAFSNYVTRMKIKITGTKPTQYLDGEYEGKTGRITGAQEIPGVYEQTARVRFDKDGEQRSIITRYIEPDEPDEPESAFGGEVLVLGGEHKGRVLVLRDTDANCWVVSTRENPSDVQKVPTGLVVLLYEVGVS